MYIAIPQKISRLISTNNAYGAEITAHMAWEFITELFDICMSATRWTDLDCESPMANIASHFVYVILSKVHGQEH